MTIAEIRTTLTDADITDTLSKYYQIQHIEINDEILIVWENNEVVSFGSNDIESNIIDILSSEALARIRERNLNIILAL